MEGEEEIEEFSDNDNSKKERDHVDQDVLGFVFEYDPEGHSSCVVVKISQREKARWSKSFNKAIIIMLLIGMFKTKLNQIKQTKN